MPERLGGLDRLAGTVGLGVLLAAAACGGSGQAGARPPAHASVLPPSPPAVALSISYTDGAKLHLAATITCRPGLDRLTGFLRLRSATRVCARARALRYFLSHGPPPHQVCTQIYGGPDRALVRGTIGSSRVYRQLARRDGCEVAEWGRASLLLPPPSGRL